MKRHIYLFSLLVFGFLFQNAFAQTNWYLKTGSTDVGQLSSWTDDINGGAPTLTPTAFNTANTIWHIKNNAVATLTTVLTSIPATSKVLVETNCELIITGGGRISTCLLDANANATVTINNSRKYRPNTIAASAVFSLTSSSAVLIGSNGSTNPGAAFLGYGDVIVDAAGPLMDGDCIINGSLAITAGNTFGFDFYSLTLNGTIPVVSTGSLVGDGTAILNINGGNGGSIQFDVANGGDVLDQLNLNLLAPANELSISNSFTVFSQLNIQQGYLKIDNINVTIDGAAPCDFILPASPLSGGLTSAAGTTLTLLGDANQAALGSNIFAMKTAADQIDLINVNTTIQTNPFGIASAGNIGTISISQGSFAFGQTAAAVVNNTLSTVNNGGALMFNGNTGATNINTVTVSGGTINMSGTSVLNATLAQCNSASGQLISSNNPQLNVNTFSLTAGQTAFAGGTQTFTNAIVTDATLGINAGAISIATLDINHANAQINASPANITMDTVFALLANSVNLSPTTSGNYKFISITDAPVTVGGAGSFNAVRVLANHANAQFNASASNLSADTISALLANAISLSSATSANYNLISITDAPVTVGGAGTFNVANKLVLNNNANASINLNGGVATLDSLFAFNGAIIHSNSNLNANKIRLDGGVSYTGNSSGSSAIGDFWVFNATVNNNNGTYTISDSLVTNDALAQIDFVGTTAVSINTLQISNIGGVVQISGSGANDILQSNVGKGSLSFSGTTPVTTHTILTSHTNAQVTFNNGAVNTCTYISMNNGQLTNTSGTLNLIEGVDFSGSSTFNTGNNLVLKYNSGKTARIGNLTGQTFNGQVTSEISFPAGTTGWAALGVNGITGKTLVDWDKDTPANNGNGIPMTCNGCNWDVTIFTPTFASVCQNDPNYTPLISTSGLNQGEGYWFYLGDGYPGGPSGALTWSTKGNIVSGNISTPGSTAGQPQDFLVANTYPSPIDPALFITDNNANLNSNSYYIYSRDCGPGTIFDIDPIFPNCNNCGCGITLATDPIPSGQGFFLDANNNIQFNETQKISTNQNNNPLAKQILAPVQSKCKIQLQNGNGYDECTIYRDNRFTLNWDKPYEARKKYSSISKTHPLNSSVATKGTIASVGIEGTDYATQGFPFTYTNITIPMRTKVNKTGSYTITATDFGTWDGCLLLRDRVTLIEQDLTKGPYSFTINDTTDAPRFELSICSSKQTGNSYTDLNSPVQFFGHGLQTDVILNFNASTQYKIIVSNILGQIVQHPIKGHDAQKRITIDVPLHELRFIRVEAEGRVYHQKCIGQ
ncbi:MAG: beta strand repeat-containing protein [Bacteroidota bacterium]